MKVISKLHYKVEVAKKEEQLEILTRSRSKFGFNINYESDTEILIDNKCPSSTKDKDSGSEEMRWTGDLSVDSKISRSLKKRQSSFEDFEQDKGIKKIKREKEESVTLIDDEENPWTTEKTLGKRGMSIRDAELDVLNQLRGEMDFLNDCIIDALNGIEEKVKQESYTTVEDFDYALHSKFRRLKGLAKIGDPMKLADLEYLQGIYQQCMSDILEDRDYKTFPKLYLKNITYKDMNLKMGDFVHVFASDRTDPHYPLIGEIMSMFKQGRCLEFRWYHRPIETFHKSTEKFYENEVFRGRLKSINFIEEVLEKVYVLHKQNFVQGYPKALDDKQEDEHINIYIYERAYYGNETCGSFKSCKSLDSAKLDLIPYLPHERPQPKKIVPSPHLLSDDIDY